MATCGICGKSCGLSYYKFRDGKVCFSCFAKAGGAQANNPWKATIADVVKNINKQEKAKEATKKVRNTVIRQKCNTCGKVFCFTGGELLDNAQYANQALSSSVMSVVETVAGSRVGSYLAGAEADRAGSKIVDYTRCPYCKSDNLTSLTEEEFIKEVQSNNASGTIQLSPADEIKKYKELLDSGIISQEEFDTKKKQLLGL